jgi:hypothetical protein
LQSVPVGSISAPAVDWCPGTRPQEPVQVPEENHEHSFKVPPILDILFILKLLLKLKGNC